MSLAKFLTAIGSGSYDKRTVGKKSDDLGKYGISSSSWVQWAAAAGLPGAKWNDPAAQDKVAAYIGNDLYHRLGSWGLVAVAWEFGTGVAQTYKNQGFGDTPNVTLDEKHQNYANRILGRMGGEPAPPPSSPGPSRGADVEVVMEQPTEEEIAASQAPQRPVSNPANVSLTNVLSNMSDASAGGRRLTIEEVEAQQVPESDEMTAPTTSKSTKV